MTNQELAAFFQSKGADWEFTQQILESLNEGTLRSPAVEVASFPQPEGKQILDLRLDTDYLFEKKPTEKALGDLGLKPQDFAKTEGGSYRFSKSSLEKLGLQLVPKTAFGILNGGMATSYGDSKRNRALGDEVFELYREDLERLAEGFQGRAKGITPAFFQKNGTPGPSYLELKIRHLVLLQACAAAHGAEGPGLKLFQMTSGSTSQGIAEALEGYAKSPVLEELKTLSAWDWAKTPTAVQSLLGTFTRPQPGVQREIFLHKGENGPAPYLLPGGHGQNFRVLKSLYHELSSQGYKFVYLGNVDNLGYLVSLKSLALLALTGSEAGFDFSFKTPFDVKGGVLYRDPSGRLNCADIGVGLSRDLVEAAVKKNQPLLFNCATGLFCLDDLLQNLDRIIAGLPVRTSDQDKDAGRYTQAEQVTWEVIGLLERPLIFGVEKRKRFLAAKLLIDCLMTSGLHLEEKRFDSTSLEEARHLAQNLNTGLGELLEGPYGFSMQAGLWKPLMVSELQDRLSGDLWTALSV